MAMAPRRTLTLTATEAFVYRGHAVRKGKTFQARVVDTLALVKRKKATYPPPGTCDGVNTITATPNYRGQAPRPAIAYAVPVTAKPPAPPAPRPAPAPAPAPPTPEPPVPPAPTPPDPEIRRPVVAPVPGADEPADDETRPRRRYRRRDLEP